MLTNSSDLTKHKRTHCRETSRTHGHATTRAATSASRIRALSRLTSARTWETSRTRATTRAATSASRIRAKFGQPHDTQARAHGRQAVLRVRLRGLRQVLHGVGQPHEAQAHAHERQALVAETSRTRFVQSVSSQPIHRAAHSQFTAVALGVLSDCWGVVPLHHGRGGCPLPSAGPSA